MKNLIIVSLLALGLTHAKAQENDQEGIKLGIKGGLNYTNVYDTEGEDFVADSKFGWAAGGFLSIPLNTHIGLQPEVLYSQKGFIGSGTFLGMGYSYSRTLSYLDVPIYFVLKPTSSISFLVGPQYSYLMRQRNEFHSDLYSNVQEEEFENENIRKNTLGISTGLDINFNNTVIGLRIAWDLQDNNGDGTSSLPNYKNTLIQGTIGFKF